MKMRDVDIYWGDKGVCVVKRRDHGHLAPQAFDIKGYQCSTGACCEWWKDMRIEHLLYVFIGILAEGHPFEDAHCEFMKIDEYKKFYNSEGIPRGQNALTDLMKGF